MPPSVTTSSRFFIAIGVTEVIGSTPVDIHLGQLLDERQHGVELALQVLDLIVRDRDARQMRDAADGCGIDGHENLVFAQRISRGARVRAVDADPDCARRTACTPARQPLRARRAPPVVPRPAAQYKERHRKAAAMDAPNPSATVTFANRTPLRIGAVGLKARDLSRLTDFYTNAIGLQVLDRDGKTARLGAGGVTLLELEAAPDAAPDDPRTAGLYHTAFLQPTRADLGRWLVHVGAATACRSPARRTIW